MTVLYYDRTDKDEGTDPTKSNNSRECTICHYWFFNYGFKFQDHVCNGCHDLAILCHNKVILLLSLLKISKIIVVLCITLANLKHLIY